MSKLKQIIAILRGETIYAELQKPIEIPKLITKKHPLTPFKVTCRVGWEEEKEVPDSIIRDRLFSHLAESLCEDETIKLRRRPDARSGITDYSIEIYINKEASWMSESIKEGEQRC